MRLAWLVTRAWGLDRALALATVEGIAARYWWHSSVQVPTIERAIPMAAVLPPLLAISLTGALVELWPQQMETTARSPVVIRAVRFGAVFTGGVLAAFAASGQADRTPIAATAVGVTLAGVAAPTLRRWTWMPLLLAGYGWMQYAAMHPYGQVPHLTLVALGALVVGGVAYALDLRAIAGGP